MISVNMLIFHLEDKISPKILTAITQSVIHFNTSFTYFAI